MRGFGLFCLIVRKRGPASDYFSQQFGFDVGDLRIGEEAGFFHERKFFEFCFKSIHAARLRGCGRGGLLGCGRGGLCGGNGLSLGRVRLRGGNGLSLGRVRLRGLCRIAA